MVGEDSARAYGRVVAKAWSDDGFKARLMADPVTVLQAEGLAVPAGLTVTVLENTPTRYTLVLPARPTDLSDDDLDEVAGGWCSCVMSSDFCL
ncbi:NHLP leader peptide family RiPP precursor [Nitrospirillum amazonense]|uniref:Putative ribosomally synthesized peptide n=1 Tax=Nitrospirillum amazonense TaxID=28077 RepID=A0A560JMH9_9PROT|nr:NHLP leader peptide family RiPP precursor [Nitrospirillum amazonense]MDG3439620.1 NHLP leader peptide family RiPP precursor [Nitrospirillum amazonense]TWB70664.1 putative ribosomally synthesized peptide [Nitrospirillum amazonense]